MLDEADARELAERPREDSQHPATETAERARGGETVESLRDVTRQIAEEDTEKFLADAFSAPAEPWSWSSSAWHQWPGHEAFEAAGFGDVDVAAWDEILEGLDNEQRALVLAGKPYEWPTFAWLSWCIFAGIAKANPAQVSDPAQWMRMAWSNAWNSVLDVVSNGSVEVAEEGSGE